MDAGFVLFVAALVFALSALGLGLAVVRAITALRRPSQRLDRTLTNPVLLDGWDLPSDGVPTPADAGPPTSPAPR